jgi:hypothetical protein
MDDIADPLLVVDDAEAVRTDAVLAAEVTLFGKDRVDDTVDFLRAHSFFAVFTSIYENSDKNQMLPPAPSREHGGW